MLKQKRYRSKKYLKWVRSLTCSIARCAGSHAHHLIGHNQGGTRIKASDLFAFPLSLNYHTGNNGIHILGTKTWESKHGNQWIHVAATLKKGIEAGAIDKSTIEAEINNLVSNEDDRQYLIKEIGLEIPENQT